MTKGQQVRTGTVIFEAGKIIRAMSNLTSENLEQAALTEGLRPEYADCLKILAGCHRRLFPTGGLDGGVCNLSKVVPLKDQQMTEPGEATV